MPDFSVSTAFTGQDKISKMFDGMGRSADKFGKKTDRAFGRAGQSASRFGDIVKGILAADLIRGSISAIRELGASSIQAAADMEGIEKSFQAIFKQDAGKELAFVGTSAEKLGLDLVTASKSFISIAASARGTALEGKVTRDIFLGVSEAATSLQLSADKTDGALMAISQIMSKGKVQAEELRGQLGERIPGAFQIAARAMGMTTSELDKFMSMGKLTAEKFIPLFAKQLRKEFGQSAMDAAKSFRASMIRFNNLSLVFKRNIGAVMLPVLLDLMKSFTPILKRVTAWTRANRKLISTKLQDFFRQVRDVAVSMIPALKISFGVFKSMLPVLKFLAPVLPILATGMIAYSAALRAQLALGAIKHFVTFVGMLKAAAGAQGILNVVMAANPIGAVITGLTLLVAAGVLVVKNWDKIKSTFRSTLEFIKNGIPKALSVIKQAFISTGEILRRMFIDPLVFNLARVIKMAAGIGAKLGGLIGIDTVGLQNLVSELESAQKEIETRQAAPVITAPNATEAAARRQNVNVQGRIDIAGAPEGSTATVKTAGPPASRFNMQMLGESL